MDETKVQIGNDVLLDVGINPDWYISSVGYECGYEEKAREVTITLRNKGDENKLWRTLGELIAEPKDEPQTIIGERFPSYITENNAQVLDGWQANPRTSTTAVEDEPQTVLEAVLERQTDEDRRKMEESIRKAIKDEPQTEREGE